MIHMLRALFERFMNAVCDTASWDKVELSARLPTFAHAPLHMPALRRSPQSTWLPSSMPSQPPCARGFGL